MPAGVSPALQALFDAPVLPGRVTWIGLRPARHAPVSVVAEVQAQAARGLLGDRYDTARDGARQVTLIQAEHLPAIAAFLGRDGLDPALLRRNLVVAGINLQALKGRRFQVGESAVLEHSGECDPCTRMEEALGPGGFNAMRRHGGITARVRASGLIRIGDAVTRLEDAA
jgi:MOSC domain-containing protein YiiM